MGAREPTVAVRLTAFFIASVGVWPTVAAFVMAAFGGWSAATTVEFVLIGLAGAVLLASLGRLVIGLPLRRVERIGSAVSCAWLVFTLVGFFEFNWVLLDFNGGTA